MGLAPNREEDASHDRGLEFGLAAEIMCSHKRDQVRSAEPPRTGRAIPIAAGETPGVFACKGQRGSCVFQDRMPGCRGNPGLAQTVRQPSIEECSMALSTTLRLTSNSVGCVQTPSLQRNDRATFGRRSIGRIPGPRGSVRQRSDSTWDVCRSFFSNSPTFASAQDQARRALCSKYGRPFGVEGPQQISSSSGDVRVEV